MFDQFLWLPFLIAITALTLTPGVDTLLVMRNAARGGHRDGLLTSLGICLGLFIHASISAAGLSVILLGSAELFMLLKLAGAAYLIWLGVQSLRSAINRKTLQLEQPEAVYGVPVMVSLREGLLSNVLNPKPIIFYMAFLPQFIDPAYSALPQALMMATVHFSIGMLWQGALVLMVGRARRWLQQPRVAKVLDSITGVLLIGFGTKLASSN
ncbi:LysE family translocator [Pontibacterium sp. N1Y112]|uniref:LysE family translocator n=1 Tax=Pontibacterium sinense TaxID=2781979 RepID=A0A8J7FIH7_9GAMM|nr:LysE family translocator [Pontibacterium sinense]MBE9398348.1 LysE family translocator [Pontibacterium sinense]